jgi:hypothetical protein
MDLRGLGPLSPNVDPTDQLKSVLDAFGKAGTLPGGTPPAEDTVAALLQALATPQIASLLNAIDERRLPANSAAIEDLLRAAISAASDRDVTTAIGKLTELIKSVPERAEVILTEPALQSIRGDIEILVRRLTVEARGDAEPKVANAARLIETGAPKSLAGDELNLQTVLTVASRFFDQARLVDYLRAGDLAQVVIDRYGPAPALATGLTRAVPAEDIVATVLQDLATPQIADLIHAVDQRRMPENGAAIEDLMRAAISAVANRDVATAVVKLTALVSSAPEQSDAILTEPALQSIRGDVENLLRQLTSVAKSDAEQKLTEAARVLETASPNRTTRGELNLETVLAVANRFFDQARFAGYVRAGDLAQVVIDHYSPEQVPIITGVPVAAANRSVPQIRLSRRQAVPRTRPGFRPWRAQATERLKGLWRRAPLLVLLLGWLALGLVGGVSSLLIRNLWPDTWEPSWAALGFESWGIGFLALVGFGFYMRVRNIKS